VQGGFSQGIQGKYRSSIGDRSNDLGGNLVTKDGIFGSNEIASQFNLFGGSDVRDRTPDSGCRLQGQSLAE
jgi:hypothetical protein